LILRGIKPRSLSCPAWAKSLQILRPLRLFCWFFCDWFVW